MIVLDIGNGMKGGTPESPQMVVAVQVRSDCLYQRCRQRFRPGLHPRHAHGVAARNYVFIADEVFPTAYRKGTRIASFARV